MTPESRDRSSGRTPAFCLEGIMKNPCTQGCPDRTPECRLTCEKFRLHQEALEKRRKALKRERMLDSFISECAFASSGGPKR